MRRKTKRQRKRLLKTFDKGSTLRKALKKSLKDKRVSRKEIAKLTKKGASLNQLQRIRKKSNKLSRFEIGNRVDQRKEVKKVFQKVNRKQQRANSVYGNLRIDPTEASNTIPKYVRAPEKETTPPKTPKTPKTPTAAKVDDELKIGALDTDSTPEQNLETLATDSNVERFAGDMSGTLAEQAAAADMTIEQFKEKMNDPA